MQLPGLDPGLERDLLHRDVRDLHPLDLRMPSSKRLEARVELGKAGCPGTPMEVGHAESVSAALEVVQKEGELALVEDRLVADAASPCLRSLEDAQAGRELPQLAGLVCEHPLGTFLIDDQPRVRRPPARACADRGTPERASYRRARAAHLRAQTQR